MRTAAGWMRDCASPRCVQICTHRNFKKLRQNQQKFAALPRGRALDDREILIAGSWRRWRSASAIACPGGGRAGVANARSPSAQITQCDNCQNLTVDPIG
jgi:hypothetical protein